MHLIYHFLSVSVFFIYHNLVFAFVSGFVYCIEYDFEFDIELLFELDNLIVLIFLKSACLEWLLDFVDILANYSF